MNDEVKDAGAVEAAPRYVGDKPRSRTIPLEYPFEFKGVTYTSVTVSRMTGVAVSEFMKAVREHGADAHLPMFDCPQEVIGLLDADDAERVDEAVMDFLPRALRQVGASSPQSGGSTSE
ncbi:phage tail assembly protein [Rhodopseudomonas palustris]|nr:phage tail assembly protein [Rhodopseudomonas palustris]